MPAPHEHRQHFMPSSCLVWVEKWRCRTRVTPTHVSCILQFARCTSAPSSSGSPAGAVLCAALERQQSLESEQPVELRGGHDRPELLNSATDLPSTCCYSQWRKQERHRDDDGAIVTTHTHTVRSQLTMGQRLCGCLVRTCCPTTASDSNSRNSLAKPALQKKDDDAASAIVVSKQQTQQQQQPLVVEDESWKRWSSYNLIHHQSEPQRQQSAYHPPVYVSPGTGLQQIQQSEQPHHIVPAEAVWDL